MKGAYIMKICLTLYATFRLLAGVKHIMVELPDDASLKNAIDAAAAQVPVLRQHWLDEAGELFPHVHVFINGEDAATLPEALHTILKPGDQVDFFPPVAGGAPPRP